MLSPQDRHLLLQTALVSIHFGLYEDAFNLLERYVVTVQFSDDAVLLGHTGLASYLLWRAENPNQNPTNAVFQPMWNGYAGENSIESPHFRNALLYLQKSVNAPNGFDNDIFVYMYAHLLQRNDDFSGAEAVLLQFRGIAFQNPNSCRYILELYHSVSQKIGFESAVIALDMLKLDPLCEPELALIPLIEFKESTLNSQAPSVDWLVDVLGILAKRLDFHPGDEWTWRKLVQYTLQLRSISSTADGVIWYDRQMWWLEAHMSRVTSTDDDNLCVIKVIALYLVIGPSPHFVEFIHSPQCLVGFHSHLVLANALPLGMQSYALLNIPPAAVFEQTSSRFPDSLREFVRNPEVAAAASRRAVVSANRTVRTHSPQEDAIQHASSKITTMVEGETWSADTSQAAWESLTSSESESDPELEAKCYALSSHYVDDDDSDDGIVASVAAEKSDTNVLKRKWEEDDEGEDDGSEAEPIPEVEPPFVQFNVPAAVWEECNGIETGGRWSSGQYARESLEESHNSDFTSDDDDGDDSDDDDDFDLMEEVRKLYEN
ncbi:hypothetical protein HDU84_007348 [Entophlyctis sp. JEL0112]|nr:hypothetical protein HDU84_007348 [Entophlyctis sp. JEL0112]